MGTINHKIEILNDDGTAYDVYHLETNTGQVYDYTKSKWLSDIISEITSDIANLRNGTNEESIIINELISEVRTALTNVNTLNGVITTIQTELAKKYVKPSSGISLEDLNASIRSSLNKADRVTQIEQYLNSIVITIGDLTSLNTEDKSSLTSAINEIVSKIADDDGGTHAVEWSDILNKPILYSDGSTIVKSSSNNPPSYYYSRGGRTFNESVSERTLGISNEDNWASLHTFVPYINAQNDTCVQIAYCTDRTLIRYSIGRNASTAIWGEWLEMETTEGSQSKIDLHANNLDIHITEEEKLWIYNEINNLKNINLNIPDASATTKGIVQLTSSINSTSTTLVPTAMALKTVKDSIPVLNDTVTSTSTTQGATANALKTVYDLAVSKLGASDTATSANKLSNSRRIDGVNFDGTTDITHYAICSTASGTVAKIANLNNFELVEGARVTIKFVYANTATNPTLNISSKGAIPLRKSDGTAFTNIKAGVYTFVYDGLGFIVQGEGGEYGTATASQVLSGYTIGTEGGLVSGSITNRSGTIQTGTRRASSSGYVDASFPAGYYDGATNTRVRLSDSNFIASNIKNGISMFGLTGTNTGNYSQTSVLINLPSSTSRSVSDYYYSFNAGFQPKMYAYMMTVESGRSGNNHYSTDIFHFYPTTSGSGGYIASGSTYWTSSSGSTILDSNLTDSNGNYCYVSGNYIYIYGSVDSEYGIHSQQVGLYVFAWG